MSDALAELSAQGVSIWLDDISRDRLRTGSLADLVAEKHVVGVTSNPTIFQKALEKGDAYDDQARDLQARRIPVDDRDRMPRATELASQRRSDTAAPHDHDVHSGAPSLVRAPPISIPGR